MLSCSWEAPVDASDMGEEAPCLGAFDGFLPILGEPSAAPEPGEGTLEDPAAWQNLKAFCHIGTFDDLDRPAPDADQGGAQFGPGIAAIGENVAKFRNFTSELFKHAHRPVTVLNISSVDAQRHQIATGVAHDVALAAFDLFLPASYPESDVFSVVLTL